jgi:putative polyketide hydroxylase
VWVADSGRSVSTLDLFDGRMVLLAGEDGRAWCEGARWSAAKLGVPLAAYVVGGELGDPTGRWRAAYGVGIGGAVLVRPDGHVAWRSVGPAEGTAADTTEAMTRALRRALARTAVERDQGATSGNAWRSRTGRRAVPART